MRFSVIVAVLGSICLLVVFGSERASAANIPPDDIDPVFRDLLCVLDPSQPFCPGCPPYCLNKLNQNIRTFSKKSAAAIKQAGIVSKTNGNQLVILNRRGDGIKLTCRPGRIPANLMGKTSARRVVNCHGIVGNKDFDWRMTFPLDRSVSRKDAIEFKRFVTAARPLFSDELRQLSGDNPQATSAPLNDYLFCGIVSGATTAGAGPVVGGAVAGLCGWFASNGLD